ncbi:hypothetical protein ACFQ4K_28640 [Tistrella bauzanensis]
MTAVVLYKFYLSITGGPSGLRNAMPDDVVTNAHPTARKETDA